MRDHLAHRYVDTHCADTHCAVVAATVEQDLPVAAVRRLLDRAASP